MEEKLSTAQKILDLVKKEQDELENFTAGIKKLSGQGRVFFTEETQDEKNHRQEIIELANHLIKLYS